MKVIKILVPVNLNSGLETPKNTILTITEGYADIKAKNLDPNTDEYVIPSQIANALYINAAAVTDPDIQAITGILDFPQVFNANLSVTDYETLTAEDLLINGAYNALVAVYGEGNVQIVSI
jgi:hypothetical protein